MSNNIMGRVTGLTGKTYFVNLQQGCCSCGRYQENAVPCAHAISCIYRLKHQPLEFMPHYLTIEAYNKTYLQNIGFVNLDQLSETPIHQEFAPAVLTHTSLFSSNRVTRARCQPLTTNSSLARPNQLPTTQLSLFNTPSPSQPTTTSPISNSATLLRFLEIPSHNTSSPSTTASYSQETSPFHPPSPILPRRHTSNYNLPKLPEPIPTSLPATPHNKAPATATTDETSSSTYVSAFGWTVQSSPLGERTIVGPGPVPSFLQTPIPCRPPILSAPRGRPKVVRKRTGELRRKRQLMSGQLPDIPDRAPQLCSNCGGKNHNSRTCRQPPKV